jgi:hypothetical protein
MWVQEFAETRYLGERMMEMSDEGIGSIIWAAGSLLLSVAAFNVFFSYPWKTTSKGYLIIPLALLAFGIGSINWGVYPVIPAQSFIVAGEQAEYGGSVDYNINLNLVQVTGPQQRLWVWQLPAYYEVIQYGEQSIIIQTPTVDQQFRSVHVTIVVNYAGDPQRMLHFLNAGGVDQLRAQVKKGSVNFMHGEAYACDVQQGERLKAFVQANVRNELMATVTEAAITR